MSKLIFLDLETTGLDTETCEIIEVGYGDKTHTTSDLFQSYKPIPFEVSGITNIDNADVANCPYFDGSSIQKLLQKIADDDYIAVTHNTDFDLEILARYGINFKQSICTHKLAWKLLPNLANHKLGTLRAYFYIPHGDGVAHRAGYDVEILEKVYDELADIAGRIDDDFSIEHLVDISNQAKAEYQNTWHFGQFKGTQIDPARHADYIHWNIEKNQSLDQKTKQFLINKFHQLK